MNVRPFEGQVAVVTGAGSGIGAATARLLAMRGARLILLDIDPVAVEAVAQTCGDCARPVALDATDAKAVAAAFADIDILHLLVNNAGGGAGAALSEMDAAQWRDMVALNLDSAFHCLSGAIPRMPGGAIVNVASLAARHVSPRGGAAYAAAKAGIVALSRQAAFELAGRGIRVNTVLPGPVRTPLTRASARRDGDFPLGRWVAAEDIAEAICFLLGPQAAMCTGAELVVDGGASLKL